VTVTDSIVGLRSRIGRDVRIKRSMLMGADYYETPDQLAANRREGRPDIGIGEGCTIEGAIIDKNARIGRGVVIGPHPSDEFVDKGGYVIRDGIVIVVKSAVIPDGTTI